MNTLTGIIIAKNEENMIGDCLDTLSFCDEIIVVDNDSSDNTRKVAEEKKARVIQVKNGGFSALRTVGLENAKSEWVLYIDADERVSDELKKNIMNAIQSNSEENAYRLARKNYYLGTYEWPQVEHLERLFKKSALKKWYGDLHESPEVGGKIGSLKGYIKHFTHRNIEYMLKKTNSWSDIEARLRYESNHPSMSWWRFFRVMGTSFIDVYLKQGGWKVGTAGLIESIYQSFSMFITYAKLWEMQIKKK